MAANYYCLLFDLDGTLLDFEQAERQAISSTLANAGLPDSEDVCAAFSSINAALWNQLEQGQIKKEKLMVQRFSQLLETLGTHGDPVQLNNRYQTFLSDSAPTFPGAAELLAELAEFATLAVVSNGSMRTQTGRLEKSGLAPYFDDVFVSEKLGVVKPNPKFFERAMQKLGVTNPHRVLVIGDSLAADIKGGKNAGIDTCWCNFFNAENTTDIVPTHTVRNYEQLKLVAVGKEELENATLREKRHLV